MLTEPSSFRHASSWASNSPELGIALLNEESENRTVGQPSVFAILGYLPPIAHSYPTRLSNCVRYTGCDVISE